MSTQRPVSIITGGTGGIGFATARELAGQGHDLVLTYRNNEARAQGALQKLTDELGVRVVLVGGDLADSSLPQTVVDTFTREFPNRELRALLHLAGLYVDDFGKHHLAGGVESLEIYDYYQSLYPKAFIRLVEASLPHMHDGKGRILTVSTPGCNATQAPRPRYALAGQAKATLEQLVRYYALFLAPRRITINTVIPGITLTDGWKQPREEVESMAARRCPMKQVLDPQDIAHMLGFLASEKAAFVTGQTLCVDGGLHLV